MKKLLPLLVLLVAACIPVEDFSVYWDKGVIDKAFLGQWEPDPAFKQTDTSAWLVAAKGNEYRIDSLDKQERTRPDYKPVMGKTLKAGSYTFLMAGPQKGGDVLRYVISGNVVKFYNLKAGAMFELLHAKYGHAKNITAGECTPECKASNVEIKTFDDEVFGILSAIPDTEEYWRVYSQYKRAK